jgi:hypothetical protein
LRCKLPYLYCDAKYYLDDQVKEDAVVEHVEGVGRRTMRMCLWWGDLKESDHLKDLGADRS